MQIFKNLFGKNAKIHVDEIVTTHNNTYKPLSNSIVVETGENAKGRWTKFGDGTLIQYSNKVVAPAPNTQVGSIWRSASLFIEYPIKFETIQIPAISVNVDSDTGFSWTGLGDKAASNEGVSVSIFAGVRSDNTSKVSLIAIGRWK